MLMPPVQKRVRRSGRPCRPLAAGLLLLGAVAAAEVPGVVVPTGRQEYFVLGYEQHLYNILRRVYDEYGFPLWTNRMNSVVSAVVSADDQIVTYDHWEDGLEADPWSLTPSLATTLVLGDNDPTNGRACDWITCGPGHPEDALLRGDALTFASNQTCTGNAAVQCYVAIPRAVAAIRFDGGDRIVTSGGPLSIIHDQNPNSPYSGGSTEVLPKQAYTGAASYSIPVGEDRFAGDNTPYEFVEFAAIDLVAFEADTQVFINSPGAGTVSFTLQAGQHYTNCNGYSGATFACNQGAIDSVAGAAAPVTINAGTKIASTKPVAILLFTAAHGNYATDFMPVLPDLLHGNDYILPSPGDNPVVNGNRPFNIYAYNPDPVNALVVNTTDTNGSATLSLATNQTLDYSARNCGGACPTTYVPSNSSVRLTAPRNFWGVAVHDHQGASNDWGYAWLATTFLKSSYTVPYAPGVRDPVAAAANRRTYDGRNDADCRQPPLPPGPGTCDSINRAPVFVAAARDGTYVKVDFDNDGIYDIIDRNSDDMPDDGQAGDSTCGTDPYGLGYTNCLYLVNALDVLRVYDYTDYDNTGTRAVALGGKPIAMSYGQDTDEATGSDDIQDTGYTVYPLTQRFLDPVLVAGKEVSPTAVSGSGGQATFTLHLQSFAFAPLESLAVTDVLPAGLTYVAGSTLITYPNLAQGTGDPTIVDGDALPGDSCPANTSCLTWTLSPDSLNADQLLTVRFTVDVGAGAPAVFANEMEATAVYSGRTYRARGAAELVRTDLTLTKIESDDGAPEPGDVVTYTLLVTNNSASATETNIRVTDAIPPGTTYVAGSLSPVPPAAFGGVFSPGQNAIVWTAASLGPGASATLAFQVRLNTDLSPGTVLTNHAVYQSTQTPTLSSNETSTTVVGPILGSTKSIVGGTPSYLHPLERVTFEVQVRNSGAGSATNLRIADSLAASNATYVAGTMQYSVNGATFVPLTDAADADAGAVTGTTLELLLPSLAPSADVRLRFQAQVASGTSGLFVNNQAVVSATQVGTFDTNLVQVPIVGNATVVGRVFRDLDSDGVLDTGEPGLANVAVLVTDAGTGFQHLATTDGFGLYAVVVPAGATRLQVQTATLPPGFTLTTGAASEDQSPTALANQTISAPTVANVGYSFPPLVVTKTSSAGGTAVPGQTVTYTVTVTNTSGVTLGNVQINDPLPAGTSYVAGSARLTTPAASPLRVTEYYIGAGPFTGTTYDLILNQALATDFFVIVEQEGRSNDTSDGPDVNYAQVVAAGSGVGDLPAAAAANRIRLQRDDATDSWVGVVKVVECLESCATAGFRLLGAEVLSHTNAATTGTDTTTAWSDISRVMLVGAANGAGCLTADRSGTEHKNCHVRLWPSGTNTINWTRDAGGAGLTTATSTVMAVQWGSDWTVQRVETNANNGGADINAAGEYTPTSINPVLRGATWVWGTGHTNAAGVGNSAEGVALTLGNGTNPSPLPSLESQVAVGVWYANTAARFDVYALSHPGLLVDHRFTGTNGGTSVSQTVNSAGTQRMALVYGAVGSTDPDSFPASMLGARYASPTSVTVERRRNVGNFAAWVQGIDFSNIYGQTSALCNGSNCTDPQTNPDVLPAATYSLPAGTSLTYSYQVRVDTEPPSGLTSIDNTATARATGAGPATATTSDLLVRPRVDVEPNNAGYAHAGDTITFTHVVTNTSTLADSYVLTVTGERGWKVDLIDPDTGVVIATDLTADGTWDSGTLLPSTGTLAPGEPKEYQVRVWVPAGAAAGIQDTVRLRATSSLSPSVWDDAKDEITVLSSTLGSVIVTPDNSGVVQAGSYTAYAHRVINNTAFADTFDFLPPGVTTGTGVDSSQGWTNTIHWDTNGDGVYTPGADLQIWNTVQMASGGSQLVFVVVNAPVGTASGTRDVSHVTAWSRNNPALFGAATDTSTVVTAPRHDLSGGGSRVVAPGDTAIFPGTMVNLGPAPERFELTITASNLFGPGGDGLLHPTQLWVDTDTGGVPDVLTAAADGVPDMLIAADTDGDGSWDVAPSPAWDVDGDGLPDVRIEGGGSLAYELRRPVGLDQQIQRDHVTLSSRSVDYPSSDPDSVTATWIFAAVTRAGIQGLRVEDGEVAFATSTQSNTVSFVLHQTDDPTGRAGREALHDQPVLSPVPNSIAPILYTVPTRPVEKRFLMIEETEVDGDTVWTGPFAVGEGRLERSLDRLERRLDDAGVPEGRARWLKGFGRSTRNRAASAVPPATTATVLPTIRGPHPRPGLKIEVTRGGQVRIPATVLGAYGVSEGSSRSPLQVTNLGRSVAHWWEPRADGVLELVFTAEALRTDYSDRNVYVLAPELLTPGPVVPLTRSAEPETRGFFRAERQQLYIPSLPEGADPWQWDILFSGFPWPDPGYDPAAGDFDVPDLAPGASGPVGVRLRVVGYTQHRHSFTASINGLLVGSVTFDGTGPALLTGTIAAEALHPTGNRLSIDYVGTALSDSPASDAFAYVDYVDLGVPRAVVAGPATFSLAPWSPRLPSLRGVDYLVVTHPLFREQADRIAAEKTSDGHRTAVVETTSAYDRFSGGFVEPRAIQALVREAARRSSVLRHVLLVGDDSFDPLDYSGLGVPSFVPSLFARDSGWGLVPSENLYADLDDDALPDVAIGRLPVRTAAEADAVATKIATQEAALLAHGEAHLAVADNSTESDAPFREDAQRALDRLVQGAPVRWADLAQGPAAARAALLAEWQSGVLGTHYFGHGGLTEWADEQVLTTDDVATLGASWKPTVLFTWACLSQYFLGVYGPSVNESLVLLPGGGALASFGPAGITPPARQLPLVERVYAELRAPGVTLGEAIRRAKAAAVVEQPTSREVIDGFLLFGDPALVLLPSEPAPR